MGPDEAHLNGADKTLFREHARWSVTTLPRPELVRQARKSMDVALRHGDLLVDRSGQPFGTLHWVLTEKLGVSERETVAILIPIERTSKRGLGHLETRTSVSRLRDAQVTRFGGLLEAKHLLRVNRVWTDVYGEEHWS